MVWGLLCFYAAQLLVNVSWYDVNFVQYKNDKWASAKREINNPRICFCVLPNAKYLSREINSVYSNCLQAGKIWGILFQGLMFTFTTMICKANFILFISKLKIITYFLNIFEWNHGFVLCKLFSFLWWTWSGYFLFFSPLLVTSDKSGWERNRSPDPASGGSDG